MAREKNERKALEGKEEAVVGSDERTEQQILEGKGKAGMRSDGGTGNSVGKRGERMVVN